VWKARVWNGRALRGDLPDPDGSYTLWRMVILHEGFEK
jgi:hypothetical protein